MPTRTAGTARLQPPERDQYAGRAILQEPDQTADRPSGNRRNHGLAVRPPVRRPVLCTFDLR